MRRSLVAVSLVVLVAGVVVSLAAGSGSGSSGRWVVRDLGTLGGSLSRAVAVNNRGQVVGYAEAKTSQHAFLWGDGRMRDLGTLGGGSSDASAISDRGQVVGSSYTKGDQQNAFLWESGRMRDLGTLGGRTEPVAINSSRQVVGWGETDVYGESVGFELRHQRAFLWEQGRMRPIGPVPRDDQAVDVVGMNDRGTVLIILRVMTDSSDQVGFAWAKGKSQNLGSLGGQMTVPADLNERGQVVGVSDTKRGARRAFLWQDGRMTSLGTLGGKRSEATAINERGQIVGTSDTTRGKNHVFLWEKGRMRDLGNPDGGYVMEPRINNRGQVTVNSGSGPPAPRGEPSRWRPYVWQNGVWSGLPILATPARYYNSAVDINEKGQIVGYLQPGTTKTGQVHAVLWTKTG